MSLFADGAREERDVGGHEQRDVPQRRVGRDKRHVGDEVAEIDRMPHQAVEPGRHDAAIGRNQAEAASERHLAGDDDEQAERGDADGDDFGRQRRDRRGTHQRRSEQREHGQHPRANAAIDDRRRSAEDRQHDDQRFAREQQQAGQPAGLQEVRANPDRHEREERDDQDARDPVGDVALHESSDSRRAAPVGQLEIQAEGAGRRHAGLGGVGTREAAS